MTEQNTDRAHARRARCLDELAALQRERLSTDDARGRQPADRADSEKQTGETAAFEEGREDNHDEKIGQRVQHVDESHHQIVRAAPCVARYRAPCEPDYDAHCRGQQADEQRNAHAVERAHEQIPPQPVRAEPVRGAERRPERRGGRQMAPVEGVVSVGTQQRAHDRQDGDQDDQHTSGERGAIPAETPSRCAP